MKNKKQTLSKKLFQAVATRDIKTVKAILAQGINPDVRDSDGRTPLMLACFLGDKEMAKVLLESGADVNAKDENGRTPLMWTVIGAQGPDLRRWFEE
jgi:ankyrin repeat protein